MFAAGVCVNGNHCWVFVVLKAGAPFGILKEFVEQFRQFLVGRGFWNKDVYSDLRLARCLIQRLVEESVSKCYAVGLLTWSSTGQREDRDYRDDGRG